MPVPPLAESAGAPAVPDIPRLPPAAKARRVRQLFSAVAPTYDLLNTILSFGLHRAWRRRATDLCRLEPGGRALDVATGTGDFALEAYRRVGAAGCVVGVDFCEPMLRLGRAKAARRVHLLQGDALDLPFPNGGFDAATMGFGLRNVADIQRTLDEMARCVRPGGRVVQLELAKPPGGLFRALYYLYFQRILPWIGRLVHGRKENYAYLPASLSEFPARDEIAAMMRRAGLEEVAVEDLTFGIVAIYSGTKPRPNERMQERADECAVADGRAGGAP